MGVKGLWRLLMPIGRRISIETLEGKILAIDASIWLTQFLKAMRDPDSGSVRPAAHLIGFFRRLCKLRFHGIRPILVFDGATPEIKMREIQQRRHRREKLTLGSDGTTNSDEAVQRMAKRLLVAELNKRKQSQQKTKAIIKSSSKAKTSKGGSSSSAASSAGAFAPGFNLAEDDNDNVETPEEPQTDKTITAQTSKDEEQNKDSVNKEKIPPPPPSSIHAVELELDESEWQEAANIEAVNDFENAVVDIASSSDNDDDEKDPNYEPTYNNNRHHGRKNKTSYNNHDIFFDIGYVSKLPSHDRKGIIEEAKKKQRMQSRREFMPVAANPDAYSQTQLRNFLRSSKLNKHIVKMATKIVGEDEETVGQRMASDATRRIIFTKNHSHTDKSSSSKKDTSIIQKKDSEDDSENEWQDENEPSYEMKNETADNIVIHTTDKSDGEDVGGGFFPHDSQAESICGEGGGGYLPVSTTVGGNSKDSHQTEAIQFSNNSSEDEGSGGGFLPTSPQRQVNQAGSPFYNEGGGFLPSSPNGDGIVAQKISSTSGAEKSKTESAGVIQLDDDSSAEGGFLPSTSSDARRAQELEDEMLAKSIQKAEYEENDEPQHSIGENSYAPIEDRAQWQKTDDYDSNQIFPEKNKGSSNFVNLEDASDDDSEDDVEWEGGETEANKEPKLPNTDNDAAIAKALQSAEETGVIKTKSVIFENSSVDRKSSDSEDSDDSVDWENGDKANRGKIETEAESNGRTKSAKMEPKVVTFASSLVNQKTSDSDQDSDDNVDWEDVDGADEEPLNIESNSYTSSTDEKNSTNQRGMKEETPVVKVSSSLLRETDEFDNLPKNDFSDQPSADANTAALEHAQATAANLTDWAGRAFRRAIAAHIEETGGSPKKSEVQKSAVQVSEKMLSSSDEEEVVVVSDPPQLPSLESNESKQPRISNSGKKQNQLFESAAEEGKVNIKSKSKKSNTTPMDPLERPSLESLQEQAALYEEERNRQERDMDTITDEMKEEVIQLIRLFGIPYVEAPAEAEAQCAMLEELGLVNGIVTEDSDVFVFGGKTIYKNIFQDQKYVEAYHARDAEKELALGRNEFVALSMLLGGDYTEGVKGVGIVNGMEILQAFDVSNNVKQGLEKFRHWLDGFDPADSLIAQSKGKDVSATEKSFQVKHKTARNRWVAPQHFPAENVLNAYLNPVVDKSEESFSWGTPDLENLLLFCQRNMGWDSQETEGMLLPVIKKLEDGSRQTRIESFFMTYEDNVKFAKVKSKRLQEVFRSIQGEGESALSSQDQMDTREENANESNDEKEITGGGDSSRSKRDIESTYDGVVENSSKKRRVQRKSRKGKA